MLRFLEKEDAEKVLIDHHDGPTRGYFSGDAIARKFLRSSYYWPTVYKDCHSYVRKCKTCQLGAGKERKFSIPLQLVTIQRPFE